MIGPVCFLVTGVIYALEWAWEIAGDWLTVLRLKGD